MTTQTAQLPVTRVTVMEDRAQVERAGSIALPSSGPFRCEVPGLSLLAVDRSLKVEVTGATLVDAKIIRRWREKPHEGLPPDASLLRQRVEQLRDTLATQSDDLRRLLAREQALNETRDDLLRAMSELTAVGKPEIAVWATSLDVLNARTATLSTELRGARESEAVARTQLDDASRALQASEQHETQFECVLALTLEGAGEPSLRVSYLVPCAVWRPAYRASLSDGVVLVEADAVVWQQTGEPWNDVTLLFSTARPTLGTTPPRLIEDRLTTRPKEAIEKRVVDVSIREVVIQSAGETSGAAGMPGLDDGGEARLLVAAMKRSIPSDGQPHRIGLSSFTAPATVELVCPAELSGSAFTLARFANTSGQVLLAGPVDLIRSSGFVGRTQMKFAAANETVKLSFGSEDGVQISRQVEETREEARLTGRKTTKKRVTLHVSNASRVAHRLVIEERVPLSEVKDVEVNLLTKECSPTPGPLSSDGITCLEVSLAPNGTQTLKFAWELSAAGKVAGLQG